MKEGVKEMTVKKIIPTKAEAWEEFNTLLSEMDLNLESLEALRASSRWTLRQINALKAFTEEVAEKAPKKRNGGYKELLESTHTEVVRPSRYKDVTEALDSLEASRLRFENFLKSGKTTFSLRT